MKKIKEATKYVAFFLFMMVFWAFADKCRALKSGTIETKSEATRYWDNMSKENDTLASSK